MDLDGGLSSYLLQQVKSGLLGEGERFQLDRGILKKHFGALAANESESVSYFLRSAKRWGGDVLCAQLTGPHLKLELEFPESSPIPQRLIGDASYRLSAIFPTSHFLYELAAGYNGLAFSERTRKLSLTAFKNSIVLEWHFEPDRDLETALRLTLDGPDGKINPC